MIVRFSDLGEFVAELDHDPNAIARGIVRVTQSFRGVASLSVTRVWVVASAKALSVGDHPAADYDVVRLEQLVGELWGISADDEVKQRAAALVTELSAKLEECGFDVRAGEYELAGAAA